MSSSFSAVMPQTPTELFINNQFVAGTSTRTIHPLNPSNEEVLAHLSAASADDVDKAVKAAYHAFRSRTPGSWRNMTPRERGGLIWKFGELLEKHQRELALLESLNVGKPYTESFNYDLPQAIATYKYFAGWADKVHGKTIPHGADNLCYTSHEPLGVVGLIVPWNFPQQILAWKLAPCLATGNTVVIKPAELTPLSTLYLAKLVLQAGFPPGVINIVPGYGDEAGEALALHPRVNKISFTGSTKTGRAIQMASAKSNLKPCSLELGGKSPIIVMDDCPNLTQAVTDSFHAIFWNAGQCCSAASRIYVHEKIFDKFLAETLQMVKERKLGDPTQPNVHQGPQVSKNQMLQVLEYIDLGVLEGAKICCGGGRWGDKGFFVQPTIFIDVKDDMRISKEEIFGPVMCLYKFSTLEEALSRANDSSYGLVAAVFTKDVHTALKAAGELETGLVWINTYNVLGPSIPWGGIKLSGHDKELSEYCLGSFTRVKTVVINYKL